MPEIVRKNPKNTKPKASKKSDNALYASLLANNNNKDNRWLFDSGATAHMTHDDSFLLIRGIFRIEKFLWQMIRR